MENEKVVCPLIDEEIEEIECIENRDCIDGIVSEESLPKKYMIKDGWKDICKKCKYHSF